MNAPIVKIKVKVKALKVEMTAPVSSLSQATKFKSHEASAKHLTRKTFKSSSQKTLLPRSAVHTTNPSFDAQHRSLF